MTPAERLAELEAGGNPRLVARLSSGFVVMAENQFLAGYCLLLASPQVGQLLELPVEGQALFLGDMARVGAAVRSATSCLRCNFAIYGNVDPFLHAHIWPRFSDEPSELRTLPPLVMTDALRSDPSTAWCLEKHGDLMERIRLGLSA